MKRNGVFPLKNDFETPFLPNRQNMKLHSIRFSALAAFAEALFGRVPAEDLAPYPPAALARAVGRLLPCPGNGRIRRWPAALRLTHPRRIFFRHPVEFKEINRR